MNVKDFPADAANVVENVAKAVGMVATVSPMIELGKAMLGDPAAVMAACDQWDPGAVGVAFDCSGDLKKNRDQVMQTWQGAAASSFGEFMMGGPGTHSVAQTITDTVTAFKDISVGLSDLYVDVLRSYEQAIDHLGECGKTLLTYLSDQAAAVSKSIDIKNVKDISNLIKGSAELEKAINDALIDFITITDKIFNDAVDDLIKKQKTLHGMMDLVATLPMPDGVVDTVEEPELFHPA